MQSITRYRLIRYRTLLFYVGTFRFDFKYVFKSLYSYFGVDKISANIAVGSTVFEPFRVAIGLHGTPKETLDTPWRK
jgi:hypothetical protein